MEVLVRTLGRLAAVSPAGEHPAPSGAPGALFGRLLLAADEWVSDDELIAFRWPRATPRAGRHSLHVACSTLRGALGPARDLVENRRGAYRAAVVPLEVDVYAFRSAVATAAWRLDEGEVEEAASTLAEVRPLLRGEAFAAIAGELFAAERAAHRRTLAEANAIELECLLAMGHAEAAVATALTALDGSGGPEAWEALVRADYLRGGPEAAFRRLHEARAALGDSWSLTRLEQAIRSGDRLYLASPRRTRRQPRATARPARPDDRSAAHLELVRRADDEIGRLDFAGEAVGALDDSFAEVARAADAAGAQGELASFCAIVGGLRAYLALRGACTDGTRWLSSAVTHAELAPSSRAGCLETLALLLAHAGRSDAAARYRSTEAGEAPEELPGNVDAARERAARVVTSPDPRARLRARFALGQALRAAGRHGEAVGEIAGVVGELPAVDDRLILADALEALAAVDPDPARAGRTAGAVAALSLRMGRRPPVVDPRADDAWRGNWRDGWDAVLALPLRGPTPSTREVVGIIWAEPGRS